MNIVAIVQARLGSTRLPGKVLFNLEGKPILWHVVNRLKASEMLNRIVIATSNEIEDDKIEKFCIENNIDCFRGSENDVLDRYYQTAKLYNAESIVRITSDCPLIDPEVTDRVIREFIDKKNDYDAGSNTIVRTFPRGLDTEIVHFSILEKIWHDSKLENEREHVTLHLYNNKDKYNLLSITNNFDLSYMRWTIDEHDDYKFLKEVYSRLYDKQSSKVFLLNDILKLLESKPEISEINMNVKQKVE